MVKRTANKREGKGMWALLCEEERTLEVGEVGKNGVGAGTDV